jgi:hypothetical protein
MYYDDIIASNWSELGYLPLVQELNLENKKKMRRNAMIDRYMQGDWLTI